jgi:hypothetical protein
LLTFLGVPFISLDYLTLALPTCYELLAPKCSKS